MIRDFLALIFPVCCFVCDDALAKGEMYICTACKFHLPRTEVHKSGDNYIASRFYGRTNFKHVLAYLKFVKEGKAQKLLHKLKYENHPEVGEMLGQWYGFNLQESGYAQAFDLIVPVPLHKSKRRKRGYNQSDSFAKGLSFSLEVPWNPKVVSRVKNSETQTSKGRIERWQNVEEIFRLEDGDAIAGQRILLVDDVLTTGATLEACSMALEKGGSMEISVAVIAVAE